MLVLGPSLAGLDFLLNEGRKHQISIGCGPGEALGLIDRQLNELKNLCRFVAESMQHACLILVEYGNHRPAVRGCIGRADRA